MSKKVETKNEVETIVAVKPAKKKDVTRKPSTVKLIADEVEAEINGGTIPLTVPNKAIKLSDDGNVDLAELGDKKEYYREISRVLNHNDMTSISNYGSDLQRAMDAYSTDFLKQSFDSKSGIELNELISNLLGELHEVNIDELEAPTGFMRIIRRLPILKRFVVSVEQIKTKYNTIEKNIDGIVAKLAAARQIAIRDNNLLQKQFENNCDYVDQLGDLIIAGKMKLQELDQLITDMKDNSDEYNDYQISDVEEYWNALDKRINDLIMLRFAFKQSLTQIRIIQRTNLMNANNTEQQIAMTIPLWKNQLSTAVALYDQRKSLEVSTKVSDTTNEIIKKNAEMMKTQAIEVAKQSQRSVIDIETLRKATQDLLATVEGVHKVQQEGAQKRAAAEAELFKLEKQMLEKAIGVSDSTKHIIAKELSGGGYSELIE